MDIKVYENASEASKQLAHYLYEKISKNAKLTIGLATGRTMDAVYYHLVDLLKTSGTNCLQLQFFALDEYIGLSANDKNSYEYYLKFHLLDPLGINHNHLHMPPNSGEDSDCKSFEDQIKNIGGIDIQLLGIGLNGHIGLNEPGSASDSRTRIVALTSTSRNSNKSLFKKREVPLTAVTMGIGTILEAKECFLIATGDSKSQIIQKIINGDINSHIPATALKLHPNFKMILDTDAAKLI